MYQSIDEQVQVTFVLAAVLFFMLSLCVQVACLEALTALTKALSQPLHLSSSDDMLGSFIKMVLKGKV